MCNATLILLIPVVSCILLWFGFSGLNNNRVYVKGGRYIEKDASPINYWLNVGVYLIVGIGGLCFSLITWCLR
jgi:hypothetical protein